MSVVHLVVPDGIDDPSRPSGGNTYDRRVRDGLSMLGWTVLVHVAHGAWPGPDIAAGRHLTSVLGRLPDGSTVLVDGLVASGVPEVLVPEGRRLRLVVLVHLPLGYDMPHGGRATRERAVLAAAAAVVTTSAWTRRWLLDEYQLPRAQVHVAEPGVDAADPAAGTATGGELLCVAAVTPDKGHDVLLDALGLLADLSWRLVCVGSLALAPDLVADLDRRATEAAITDRVRFTGPLTGSALEDEYAAADVLVLASRAETYGMVVTEALSHGLPVLATTVGGLPEALGRASDGTRPGLLVPPGDATGFAGAVRRWLEDPGLRDRLRQAALDRRAQLTDWSATSGQVADVLTAVAG